MKIIFAYTSPTLHSKSINCAGALFNLTGSIPNSAHLGLMWLCWVERTGPPDSTLLSKDMEDNEEVGLLRFKFTSHLLSFTRTISLFHLIPWWEDKTGSRISFYRWENLGLGNKAASPRCQNRLTTSQTWFPSKARLESSLSKISFPLAADAGFYLRMFLERVRAFNLLFLYPSGNWLTFNYYQL